jgi:hypothetical protein
MGKRVEPIPGIVSFDMQYWLESPTLIAKARRAGIKRYVPLAMLSSELRRLVERGVIRYPEATALLDDLEAEGLISKFERYPL